VNTFDFLVAEALESRPELAPLRIVVEKELLHHTILQAMYKEGFLSSLTFIGGTCLRLCYKSSRLSEDLDFTGGASFSRDDFHDLGSILQTAIHEKYGLQVTATAPEKDLFNVDTWKIKIITRPEKKHLPAQRINIDICAVPSYEQAPMLINNFYTVNTGIDGLVIRAQSREELFTDKLLALAFRPNRIKYRDLWDIAWLSGNNISPHIDLIEFKLRDRHKKHEAFGAAFYQRTADLTENAVLHAEEFYKEMSRFLPAEQASITRSSEYWQALCSTLNACAKHFS
jgi:predicted nucleotidyltransferase component of viral defense system